MSSLTRPRGRQPARIYWVRRGLVAATAFGLVFAFAQLLGGGGDGAAPDTATQAGARTTPTAPVTTPPAAPAGPVGVAGNNQPSGTPTGNAPQAPLAEPDGPCDVDQITVTPTITTALAGAPVVIGMQVTGIKPACTFHVSSETLAVRISGRGQRVWSTQQCPGSIRSTTLVVRNNAATPYTVRWSGRSSDSQCSRSTPWSLPGTYTVAVAAIGSEPAGKSFQLLSPPRPTVTKTITPKPKPTKKPTATASGTAKVD